jgi:DNA-binding response OmpR family regulator
VVLDVVMPGMSCAEALDAIRARHPAVKVLLTSGSSEEEARRLCRGFGGVAFLQKPFTAQQLVARIRALLEG